MPPEQQKAAALPNNSWVTPQLFSYFFFVLGSIFLCPNCPKDRHAEYRPQCVPNKVQRVER